jgi:group I intron endonuclease
MNIYSIYQVQNLVDSKLYIGQTKNPIRRFREHSKHSHNHHLRHAIEKYGIENFRFIILCQTKNKNNIDYLEEHFINMLNTTDRKFGYNFRAGGHHTPLHPESKKLLSDARKGAMLGSANPNFGNYWSNDQKKHLSDLKSGSWTGKKNISCRPDMIECRRKMTFENNPNRGKSWVKKDGIEKSVLRENIQQWLDDGWIKGRVCKSGYKLPPRTPEQLKNMSDAQKGKRTGMSYEQLYGEEKAKEMKKSASERQMGSKNHRFGFRKRDKIKKPKKVHCRNRDKIWVKNTLLNKSTMIKKDQLIEYIEQGFICGRLMKNQKSSI